MVARLKTVKPNFLYQKDPTLSVVTPLISIVIPTLYRPKALHTALRAAANQIVPGHDIEIIVADNSRDARAESQVKAFATQAAVPVKYISAPEPGVANVRNAALTMVNGQYIAFLDDDQVATSGWLAKMIAQCRKDDSTAVFGRIKGRSAIPVKNKIAKLAFFSRPHNGQPSGPTTKFYGCGASLLDLSKIDSALMQFNPLHNQTGGEDDALFSAIEQAGGTFSWSKEAVVFEDVPAARLKKSYICHRSFAFGQGPSRICLEKGGYALMGLVKWMSIGAAQMVVYLPLALITWPAENAFHLKCLRKGCEGAGKFFWQSPFRPKFYGQASIDKMNKTSDA